LLKLTIQNNPIHENDFDSTKKEKRLRRIWKAGEREREREKYVENAKERDLDRNGCRRRERRDGARGRR